MIVKMWRNSGKKKKREVSRSCLLPVVVVFFYSSKCSCTHAQLAHHHHHHNRAVLATVATRNLYMFLKAPAPDSQPKRNTTNQFVDAALEANGISRMYVRHVVVVVVVAQI